MKKLLSMIVVSGTISSFASNIINCNEKTDKPKSKNTIDLSKLNNKGFNFENELIYLV